MAWNGSEKADMNGSAARSAEAHRRRDGGASSPRKTRVPLALISLFVLLAVGAAWWLLYDVSHAPGVMPGNSHHAKRGRIAEAVPAKAGSAVRTQAAAANTAAATEKAVEPDAAASTNTIPPGSYVCTQGTNRIFRSGVEQVLNMIFNTEVGEMPPPLPRIHPTEENNMVAILISACDILDSDSERIRAKKQTVDFAKKELIAYIKGGGSYQDFFKYYRNELLKAYKFRRDAQNALADFGDSDECGGDAQLVREYHRQINQKLAEKGIKPIELPEEFAD